MKGLNLLFMRRIFLVFLLSLSLYCSGQYWKKAYAIGYGAKWIMEYYDKGFCMLGVRVFDLGYSFIIKTDINGNVLWNKHIGTGKYLIDSENIELTSDNGLIIGGTISKYGNQKDAFLLKLNSCGELDWCSDIYTPTLDDDIGWRVKQTSDNGYLLLGSYNNPNPKLRTNLFKFDSHGNLLWQQSYIPDSAAFGDDSMDLTVDSNSYLITDWCYYPNPNQGGGWERFYFIKTDTSGIKLWSLIYGGTTYYYGTPFSTIESSSGNYYSFGYHDVLNSSNSVPSMVKVNKNGSPSYNADLIPNVSIGGIGASTWLNDSLLIVGGGWNINNNGGANVILKIDTLGNVVQNKILDTTSSSIYSISKTFNNKFISIATDCPSNCHLIAYKVNSDLQWDSVYTHPFTYDSLCPHPIVSDTIDPVCNLVVNVEEPTSDPETCRMKIFPNPTTGKLTIVFPKYLAVTDNNPPVKTRTVYHHWKSTTLYAYDLKGNLIFLKEIPQEKDRLELDVSSWGKGMYFFKLVYNGISVDGKKIVVQ